MGQVSFQVRVYIYLICPTVPLIFNHRIRAVLLRVTCTCMKWIFEKVGQGVFGVIFCPLPAGMRVPLCEPESGTASAFPVHSRHTLRQTLSNLSACSHCEFLCEPVLWVAYRRLPPGGGRHRHRRSQAPGRRIAGVGADEGLRRPSQVICSAGPSPA